MICPDETRLRHARRLVAGPSAISFLALERDVALAGAEAAVWRGPTGASSSDVARGAELHVAGLDDAG